MKKLFPLIVLFFALNVFSQKEANFWYFGRNAGLDFTSGNPVALTDGLLSTNEGSATISDKDGNLLFYTDGSTVYHTDASVNGGIMANGTGLLGDNSSAQSAIIVPKPLNSNIYYIFTVDREPNSGNGNGVNFSEVDITLNGNLGEVTVKNTSLADSRDAQEKITSVKGKDCNTFWVITGDNSEFQAYKIDKDGVNTAAVRSSYVRNLNGRRGYLKISPDGKTLVNATIGAGSFIYDFNDETGEITNGGELNIPDNRGYGVEFSRSSQKLYISTGVNDQGASATTANIYQFNLDDRNIAAINASIETVPNVPIGHRGALQLASNGKIYYSRSSTNFLGVINFPEKEKVVDISFDPKGVSLGVNLVGNNILASEGLPPFIQSFFSIVEIKDTDTNETINGEDLEFCIGDDKTIVPDDPPLGLSAPSYKWEFDNGTTIVEINNNNKILTLNNLQKTDNGKYTLTIELTDDCGDVIQYIGAFNIEVFEAASATKPDDINFCDSDRDGFNDFDLQADKSDEILDNLDSAIFEVLYFNSNGDLLPNPYTNPTPFSSETITARVQNRNAPDACSETTTFTLTVTDLPIPTQPDPYRICDDLESGDDTDEIINTFILNSKDNEIYGSLIKSQYNISYHTTQAGAETNDAATLIDKNANYTVNTSQTVFIRVENKDNTDCFDANLTLDLIVDALPIIKNPNPAEIRQCVNTADGLSTINLTITENNIANNPNGRFEYYEDQAGTQQILNFTSYPVDANTNPPKSVWVKTISEFGCSRISELKLIIGTAADEAYDETFFECDDLLDKDGNNTADNSDTDGITQFFLDKNTIENNINSNPNIDVFFYETTQDRAESKKAIDISNYRNKNIPNTTGSPFPIYYKLVNKINNDCEGLGEIYLQINPVPTENQVADLEECDDINDGDSTNGIVQSFNLESQDTAILGTQNPANFTVTYHLSATDANSGNAPQSSPFSNTVRDSQPIYVRVTNNITGCVTNSTSFNVIVNPLPAANFVEDLEVCDDNSDGSARNGFSQSINLENQTEGILGMQDAVTYSVTYHRSLLEAQSGNNPLTSPYSNATQNRETIYVRVYNNNTECTNGISNFDVIINPEPTFTPVSNLSYCDNDLDGDDTNGIIQNIDLESQTAGLLGNTQDPDDFIVTYHSNPLDATDGSRKLISPYTNTNTTETIYVRIQNKATLCVNDDATFQVIVNPLPAFTVTSPQILCLNNIPYNLAVESPVDIYTYVWEDENGNELAQNPDNSIDISVGGNYTITATTTNGTNCSRTRTIIVNESNIASLQEEHITIIDESNNIGFQDNISIAINNDAEILGKGDYQFAIRNDDNGERIPFSGFQDEPLFENLEGGIYTIIVSDKNGCVEDETLQISVIQFPKFFTPNGDGKNDTWVVRGANKDFYPNASMNIFNRFGKLVAQIPIDGQGWNGTYNGKLLPSDDYWYSVQLIPANPEKPQILKKGNFSLLRK